ncbi:MAG: hypothetical protein JWM68_1838 [Verrucomicrobiales bacterium]|nr:hypothetical protein [Verrucomicrobiales bacterium]
MPEAAVNEDGGFVFGQDDVDRNGAAPFRSSRFKVQSSMLSRTRSTPHLIPMTRTFPKCSARASLCLRQIPFVASQATQVPDRGGEEIRRNWNADVQSKAVAHRPRLVQSLKFEVQSCRTSKASKDAWTISSGLVSLPRMRLIFQLRRSFVNLSKPHGIVTRIYRPKTLLRAPSSASEGLWSSFLFLNFGFGYFRKFFSLARNLHRYVNDSSSPYRM